jgi:hypothetical protein
MTVGVLATYLLVMIGGFTLGMILSMARPRDQEAAAMHRLLARQALAWRPGRAKSRQVPMRPEPTPPAAASPRSR